MRIDSMWNVAHIPVETHLVQSVIPPSNPPPTIWVIDGQLPYTVSSILDASVQKLLREICKICLKTFLWEKLSCGLTC